MTNNYVVMVAGIVGAGMESYVKRYLERLQQRAKQHQGCMLYHTHQSLDDPREFMMYSVWQDKQSFEQHNQTAEMQEFKRHFAKALFDITSSKTNWQLLADSHEE